MTTRPRDIVVVGASAGGVMALQNLLAGFRPTFSGAVFIVCHTHPSGPRTLDRVIGVDSALPVSYAADDASVEPGSVKIAPPDLHMVFKGERVRLVRGPKENRTRPAIDPLFRSAARSFGPRVIGVVLSGLLDDGAAGLLAIKDQNGVAIVQEPAEARYPDMPRNALAATKVDHCVPVASMGSLIARLSVEGTMVEPKEVPPVLELEATSDVGDGVAIEKLGVPSPYSCPECSGVLWEVDDDRLLRFRCRVGHSFSAEGLRVEHRKLSEDSLWAAVRALEESAAFSRRMANRYRNAALVEAAEECDRRAERDENHASVISKVLSQVS